MARFHCALRSFSFLFLFPLLLLAPCDGGADVLGYFTGLYDAHPLTTGQHEISASIEVVHNEALPFFRSGQDRVSVPRLYGAYGVGPHAYVEASWDYRVVDDSRTGYADGPGDLRLAAQVGLAPHAFRKTMLAARALLKAPNADDTLSLGTNETDVIGLVLVTHTLNERWDLLFHAGVEILGDPREAPVQDDVLAAGIGVNYHENGSTTRFGFVAHEAAHNGNDSESLVWATRLPITRHLAWMVGGQVGLSGLAPNWGVQAGVVLQSY